MSVRATNVVFVNVPKTGGEFVEKTLGLSKSHDAVCCRKKYAPEDSIFVTILRNPLERAVSWFNFCHIDYRGRIPGPQDVCRLARHSTVDEFIAMWFMPTNPPTPPSGAGIFEAYFRHSFNVYGYCNNKWQIDYVLRTETLTEDLRVFADEFNVTVEVRDVPENPSYHAFTVDDVNPKLRKSFEEVHAHDYELYHHMYRDRKPDVDLFSYDGPCTRDGCNVTFSGMC